MSAVELVCFDLDGTLVDSERLCNQAFLELLPQLDETLEGMVARYRGVKFAPIAADLARRTGQPLPADFETRYRARVAQLFDEELQPMPGVLAMIRQLQLPFCLVSNGPLAKMRHALAVTGLAPWFGERLFSAYDVGIWKPDPGLFLHVAAHYGAAPARCVVVEDSPTGVTGAVAAGMQALFYQPHGLVDTVPAGARAFHHMDELPGLLAG
ncbi:HAD-IA family hydrolase [Silvimonas iriomotensis]|uniref:6-phosphogluconate phosphatase n=1 Tax=Silvimonas iriomotensis TaxID=449662 RepID=A0ABQ2P7L7_9NEIS|nr:HAD-IA family hydrolase [Silvimonas iriomotensis]GGP20063.1 6-phosphogluconate phosphatase [Silvimonas iriomotensis]